MATIPAARAAVPRGLHVLSVLFLLSVGLLCVMTPGQVARDAALRPEGVSGWLAVIGVALFPIIHIIAVYGRSVAASLLVAPLHAVLAILVVFLIVFAAAQPEPLDGAGVAVLVGLAVLASLEALLASSLVMWALRLRRGLAAPVQKDRVVEPELVPIGTGLWCIERSTIFADLRRFEERMAARPLWLRTLWGIARWPVYLIAWGWLILAALVVPAMPMALAGLIAGGTDGPVFMMLAGLCAAAMAGTVLLLLWGFAAKLRARVVDMELLILAPLLAGGVLLAVMVFLMPGR